MSGYYGWLGVEVFFVISGFIIPYSLYAKDYTIAKFPRFMLKRLIRLEPLYIASILLVIALAYLSALLPNFAGQEPNYTFQQTTFHLFYLIPFTKYDWINIVYWTLFYEFAFYLAIGVLFSLVIFRSIVPLYLIFISIFVAFYTMDIQGFIILNFLAGIVAFRYSVMIDSRRNFLLAISVAFIFITYSSDIYKAIISLGTVLYILYAKFPATKYLSFLGAISYSLYLIHVPIGGRVVNLTRRLGYNEWYYLVGSISGLFISVAVAFIFWKLIERPSQIISKKIPF